MDARYDLGPFRLDVATRLLTLADKPARVGPRAVAVLSALVEQAGSWVPKDALIAFAWPGVVVEEGNLAVQISALRRALSAAPGGRGWIESLARRGYRYVGPIRAHGTFHERAPGALPRSLTSFVGRDRELADIGELAKANRLVTLVGIGGVGKTRLALEVARTLAGEHPDGTIFVDVSPIDEPRDVFPTALRALAVREEPGRSPAELVAARLGTRDMLLVLDNCEHVITACAQFVDAFLRSAPKARVIATSRESLRVAGECVYPVPAMSVAATTDSSVPEAVRLFLERARLRRPDFAQTPASVKVMTALCARLDALPLAIELAAARIDALSPARMLERLDERFELLTAGDRAAAPRQQTLRATLEWSYNLLDDADKALLASLALFAGGFSLEAAESVIGAVRGSGGSMLARLSRLVEKSLVVVDEHRARYRLLDTVRHFAGDRLDASPARLDMRLRHARHYVDLAESTDRERLHVAQGEWIRRLEPEVDNIVAAHATCAVVGPEGADLALRLAAATRAFWVLHGAFAIGLRLATSALALDDWEAPTRSRAGACVSAAQLSHFLGRNGEARRYAETACVIAREAGEPTLESLARSMLANVARDMGDFATARSSLERALALADADGDPARMASTLNAIAELRRAEGKLDDAIALYDRALAVARQHEVREFVAVILVNRSSALLAKAAAADVGEQLGEALSIVERDRLKVVGWAALETAALLAASLSQWPQAARAIGAARAQREALSVQREPHDARLAEVAEELVRGHLGGRAFDDHARAGAALGYEDAVAETLAWLKDLR